jgi:hypothetical protein
MSIDRLAINLGTELCDIPNIVGNLIFSALHLGFDIMSMINEMLPTSRVMKKFPEPPAF